MVHKFAIRIKKYVVFQPRKKLIVIWMFFWAKILTSSAAISFPTLTRSLDPLTSSSDPLEVFINPISTVTLPPTVLQFSQDMDFLLSVLLVFCVTLYFFLSFLFSKRYSFKDFVLAVAFSVSFSFSLLFFLIRNWYKTDLWHPFLIHTKNKISLQP